MSEAPSQDIAREHARSWIDAWNRHDLDAILEHYADDLVFQASTVVRRFGRPDGVLRGKAELREHFRRGLAAAPSLRFELETVMLGPAGCAMVYTRDNGNRVIEIVELTEDGRARNVKVFYAADQP